MKCLFSKNLRRLKGVYTLFNTQQPKKLQASKGFSLIEMLIYVAILSAIAIVVVNITLSLAQSVSELKVAKNINSSAIASVERMARDIRSATVIDAIQSTFDVHPGRLTFISRGVVIEFYLDGDTLKVREDSVDAGQLTSNNTLVKNLIFRRLSDGPLDGVKIEMTIESSQGKIIKTENFYDFIVLRGRYF